MLEKFKDKRVWIGLIVALLFIVGIISVVCMINNHEDNQNTDKNNINIESDEDKDTAEPYDGEGMEIVQDGKESDVDMMVPESWEKPSESDGKTEGNSANVDTNKDTPKKEDSNKEDNEDQEDNSDENTLKDDTTNWGDIF